MPPDVDLPSLLAQYSGPGAAGLSVVLIAWVVRSIRVFMVSLTTRLSEIMKEFTKLVHLVNGIDGVGGLVKEQAEIKAEMRANEDRHREEHKNMTRRLDRHHHAIIQLQARQGINDPKLHDS